MQCHASSRNSPTCVPRLHRSGFRIAVSRNLEIRRLPLGAWLLQVCFTRLVSVSANFFICSALYFFEFCGIDKAMAGIFSMFVKIFLGLSIDGAQRNLRGRDLRQLGNYRRIWKVFYSAAKKCNFKNQIYKSLLRFSKIFSSLLRVLNHLTFVTQPCPSGVTDPRRTSVVALHTWHEIVWPFFQLHLHVDKESVGQLTKLRLIEYLIELETAARKAAHSSSWWQLP